MHTEHLPIHDPGELGVFALMAKAMMDPGWPSTRAPGPEKPEQRDVPATPEAPIAPRRGLLHRLERWFWAKQQRDLEAYLAQASDIHDLETRLRLIEQRGLHAYY